MVRFVLKRGPFCLKTWSVLSCRGPFCPWSVLSMVRYVHSEKTETGLLSAISAKFKFNLVMEFCIAEQ